VPLGMGLSRIIPLPWKDPVLQTIRFGADADQIIAICKSGPTSATAESLDLRTSATKTLLKAEEVARLKGRVRHPSDPGILLLALDDGALSTLDLRTGQTKPLPAKLGEADTLAG